LANPTALQATTCYKDGAPPEEAPRLLAPRGEREMAALAWEKMRA